MTEIVWLAPKEAAYFLNVSIRTLERWRASGYGPPFHKVGRKILYLKSDLEEWITEKTYRSTSEYPNGPHSMGWIGLTS
jgi:excisionase family DNA binding protein